MNPSPNSRPRMRRRRLLGLVTAALLALAAALVPTSAAHAASGPYAIDGVLVPDPGATELADAFGNVKELGPKNANTTKIGVIGNAAAPMLDLTNPNAQVDLRRAWLGSATDPAAPH